MGGPSLITLIRACHPLPTLAVVLFTGAYAHAVGGGLGRTLLLCTAVLAGQLAVGWTNDAVDAPLDAAAGRTAKPLVGTALRRRTVSTAAVVAALACVPLSLALGVVPGLLHLLAVGAAIGYDVRLKATLASPVPYLLAFGLLPVVAALGTTGVGPPVTHVVAAALLGGAAHLTNTVGDAAADAATGVRGLPQRIGPLRSLRLSAAAVAVAAVVLLVGLAIGHRANADTAVAVPALVGSAVGALVTTARASSLRGPAAFRGTLVSVALVVLGLLAS